MSITVTFEGWDEGQLRDALLDRAAHVVRERVDATVEDLLRERVAATVSRVADAAVLEAVKAELALGFRKTDRYGGATGERVSLGQMVEAALERKTRDSYGGTEQTIAESIIKKAVHEYLQKECSEVVSAVKKELAEKMRAGAAARIVEVLK